MGKIRDFFDEQRRDYLAILKRYTVTIAIGMILSVFYIIWNESGSSDSDIFVILGMTMVAAFHIETIWKAKNRSLSELLIGYVAGLFIAIGWDVLISILSVKDIDVSNYTSGEMRTGYYLATGAGLYLMILAGTAFVQLVKESNASFPEYMVRLVISVCKFFAIFFILNIGALLLVWIFDALILRINNWSVFGYVEVLLCGFVYLPFALICLSESEQEKTKFVRGLICYAMMPIVLAATAMIYLYMLKILFISDFPSNEVFEICATLFCLGVCVWTAAYAYRDKEKEEGLYDKIIKYMKYIYAPFILLEIYCIGVRILNYGATEDRMVGVWFIIAQLIYIFWEPIVCVIRKCTGGEKPKLHEGYEGLIFAAIIVYFFAVLCPVTNVEWTVYRSQKARFEEALAEERYSEARGAYRILSRNINGRPYLENRADHETLAETLSVDDPWSDDNTGYTETWSYASAYSKSDGEAISIEGAKYLYEIDAYSKSDEVYTESGLSTFAIDYSGGTVTADMRDLVNKMMKESEPRILPYNVKTSGGTLVVTNIRFSFSKDTNQVKSLSLGGYLLTY